MITEKEIDKFRNYLFFIRSEYTGLDNVKEMHIEPNLSIENFNYLYNFQGSINCPYCEKDNIMTFKSYDKFKCSDCRKQFSTKTGTIFHDCKLNYKQITIGCYLIMGGNIPDSQIAKEMGVSQKTGWQFCNKIRKYWNI